MEKTELTVSMEPERLDALRYFLAAKNKRTPQKELQRALEELYEAGTRAGVSGAKEAMDRVRAALAAPPEPQPEDKPVDKKSPLRRLLDRLKGPKSEE